MTSEWKPIESAPKDGTLLVWGLAAGEISGIHSDPSMYFGYYSPGGDYAGFDWVSCDGDAYAVWLKPTHWMPLPPKPQEDAG